MRLANPHFVFGLIGIAIPILIYLFTRQRIKQVAFSTLRFFAGASSMLVQRKKMHEMILLAMRIGACVLLAMAFARPFLASKDKSLDGLLQASAVKVVVVDLSASMSRGDLPEQIRRGVLAELQDLPGNAAVAVIGFDQTPKVIIPPTHDINSAMQIVDTLVPGQGSTDISQAIRKADELIRKVNAPLKQIVCISDLQRSGWEKFRGDWNLSSNVKFVVHPLTTETGNGLAILASNFPQSVVAENAPRSLTLRIGNSTDKDAADVPVTLAIKEKTIETRKVTVPAHNQVAVRFSYNFTEAGDNPGMVSVAGGDTPQRVCYFNTRLIPRIHVLILSDSNGSARAQDGVFFLRLALAPSDNSPFVADLARPDSVTAAQIQQAAVVILADVTKIPSTIKAALTNVPARGGGLLFMPGAQTQPDAFNALFGEMAPAKLRRILPASAGRRGDGKAILGKIDYDHPIFEIFQRPHYGDFSAVTFDQFWEVTDSQLCRVPARFDDGRPMLLEKTIGNGVSLMMACPVDLKWSNLPLRAIFLPYMHQMVRYMSLRTENQTAFVIGQSLAIPKGSTLRDPDGKNHDGETLLAEKAGFYRLQDPQGKIAFCYAVNQDPAEADTTPVEAREIIAALQHDNTSEVSPSTSAVADIANPAQPQKEMWNYLLGALALLMIGELFVANRTAEQ